MADEEGFEPPLRDYRKHDFESRAFSLSATHPSKLRNTTSKINIHLLKANIKFCKFFLA